MTTTERKINALTAEAFGISTALNALLMGYGHHSAEGAKLARRYMRRLTTLKR